MINVFSALVSRTLIGLGVVLLIYALVTQYGGMLKRPNAKLVLGTVLLEGLFVFGGLALLAHWYVNRARPVAGQVESS